VGVYFLDGTQDLRQGLGGQLTGSPGAGGQAGQPDFFDVGHGEGVVRYDKGVKNGEAMIAD